MTQAATTEVADTTTAAPADTTVSDAQADKDFEAGFTGDASGAAGQPQEKKPAATEAQPTTQAKGDAKAPAVAASAGEAAEAKTGAKPALHFGKYTDEDMNSILAKAAQVDDVRKELTDTRDQMTKMSGSLGVLHQALQAMKATGQPVKVGKDLLKKLNENGYGELAELLAEDLSGILKASVVPGTSDFDATAFQTAVDQKVAAGLDEQRKVFETKLLSISHPDWAEIYKSPDFTAWKATHPADIQNLLDTSWDSEFLAKGLTAFKKWRAEKTAGEKATEAASTAQRTKRLEAAVPPTKGQATGSGRAPPSEDELFEQGFKEARTQG